MLKRNKTKGKEHSLPIQLTELGTILHKVPLQLSELGTIHHKVRREANLRP